MSASAHNTGILAAAAGATGVAAGALGAHALQPALAAAGHLAAWTTAVEYHLLHAAVLLALALHLRRETDPAAARRLARVGGIFACGILCFSGSIYALALGAPRWLGPVTPLGGLCLVVGWIATGLALRPRRA